MAKIAEDTPMLRHYFEVKAQHPEAILLYRVGDFYECYSDDAITAVRVLGLVQTKKSNGVRWKTTSPSWFGPDSKWPSATSWRILNSPKNWSNAV